MPADYLPPDLSIDMLSSEEVRRLVGRLSRIEQMHLSVLFAHLVDRRKYALVVRQFAEKYRTRPQDGDDPQH